MKSLRSEIASLRAEMDDWARQAPVQERQERKSGPSLDLDERQASGTHERNDVEKLLEVMNTTLDEFSDDLDKHPRLTALAALGVGLALGVLIGRQSR